MAQSMPSERGSIRRGNYHGVGRPRGAKATFGEPKETGSIVAKAVRIGDTSCTLKPFGKIEKTFSRTTVRTNWSMLREAAWSNEEVKVVVELWALKRQEWA